MSFVEMTGAWGAGWPDTTRGRRRRHRHRRVRVTIVINETCVRMRNAAFARPASAKSVGLMRRRWPADWCTPAAVCLSCEWSVMRPVPLGDHIYIALRTVRSLAQRSDQPGRLHIPASRACNGLPLRASFTNTGQIAGLLNSSYF